MIETIYRNDRDEKGGPDINIRLPKNIKQIGQSDNNASCQIYIEENVISFIKQPTEEEGKLKYGVLLGDIKKGNGYTYIFINGLIEVEEVLEHSIIFGDEVWTNIYDNMKRYYREGMIVGWYCVDDHGTVDMQSMRKIHLDHFAGNFRVLLNVDRQEDEEAFYIYEGNGLKKQSCYHVYFDKSEAFEDYLFATESLEREIVMKEQRNEKGKYGIALNNTIGRREETAKDNIKEPVKMNMSKVASWGAILALTGVLAAMGLNGDLDALGQGIKGITDNVINGEKDDNMENIIPINGSPSNTGNNMPTSDIGVVSTENEGTTSQNESTDKKDEENETSTKPTEDTSKVTEKDSTDKPENGSEEKPSSNKEEETTSNQEEATTDSQETNLDGGSIKYKTYVVEKGDTLYSLALELYNDPSKIEEIVEINDLENSNHIEEGQKIFLP